MNKKQLLRIPIAIILFCVFAFGYIFTWQSGVTVTFASDTATTINVFYDNKKENDYRFDEQHMTSMYDVFEGKQSIFLPVPAENMDRLRVDFGTIPATISVYSIVLHPSPYKDYILSSDELSKLMNIKNDISNVEQNGDAIVYHISGTDGFIATETDLLNAIPASNVYNMAKWFVFSAILAVAISVLDLVIRLVLHIGKILRNYMVKLWRLANNPEGAKQVVFMIIICFVFSTGLAVLFDGVVLKILYKLSSICSMETLSHYFILGQKFSLIRAVFFFNLIFVTILAFCLGKSKALHCRYILAALLLVLMTLGQFTGSSLGFYDGMLHGNTEDYTCSTLLGIPQGIRGDEWATEKPYYFAQANGNEDFPYFNDNMMLDGADMVVHAFAPIKDIITLFRPSLLGFLFLPAENAFAFYWWFKLITLFMASFEICRLLSNKVKYGLFGAIIFSCAPVIRWWLSQSSTEIYIYGFFAVVCYSNYLTSKKKWSSRLFLVGILYFLTCYVFTIYPACQVPMGYVLLSIVIWITYKNWDKRPFYYKRVLSYIVVTIPFAAVIVRFLIMSGPALKMMLNTVYPGSDRPWLQLDFAYPLYQIVNPFTALIQHPNFLNSCEISQFYGFYIVLIPFVAWLTLHHRKKMLLPAIICGVTTFLLAVAWLPQMPLLNKITLLSMSYPVRILIACGVGYTLTVISLLPILEEEICGLSENKSKLLAGLLWMGLLIATTNNKNIFGYFLSFRFGTFLFLCTITLFSYMAYLLWRGGKKSCLTYMIILCALNFISTVCIDPITYGTDSMFEKTTMKAVRALDDEDMGRWMVSGSPTIGNLVTAQGVARVSGTYYYPDWTMMEIIDPTHEFEHYWNQFAHIDMRLTVGEANVSILDYEKSEKVDGTNRIIYIDIETAKKLGVKYVFTCVGVPDELVETDQLKLVYDDQIDPWDIYKIVD